MPHLAEAPKAADASSKPNRILIVEDETDLARMLQFNFQRDGYLCSVAQDGNQAVKLMRDDPPDLVVLDRMLPGQSGDDVLTRMRQDPHLEHIPVVMLTAKTEENDQLEGFSLGADDYVTKPFGIQVLLARVTALLRRTNKGSTAPDPDEITAGPIRLHATRHDVSVEHRPARLTVTEFRLLHALMKAGGRVLTRSQLLDFAFGMDIVVSDRTIDVHVTALRKKLSPAGHWIRTVRGVGYAFRDPVDH